VPRSAFHLLPHATEFHRSPKSTVEKQRSSLAVISFIPAEHNRWTASFLQWIRTEVANKAVWRSGVGEGGGEQWQGPEEAYDASKGLMILAEIYEW
jgi:hypothetical protein